MSRIDGKVALVTGGGRGIGAAIAMKFATAGATVVVTDVTTAEGRGVVQQIGEAGGAARFLLLDVTDDAAWQHAVDTVEREHGRLDVLVNNAGAIVVKPIEETSIADWRRLMAVNLEGPFLGVKAALPLMRESAKRSPHGGSIINMSSISGLVGSAMMPAYSTTKGGLRFFTKSMALDFARRGYRIRANSIHPGLIDTEMAQRLFEGRVTAGASPSESEARRAWIESYPIGRIGLPEDIANAALFLASDDSAYMTGAELAIDGGASAQ